MKPIRIPPTVFRAVPAFAGTLALCFVVAEPLARRERDRRERLLGIAEAHAGNAREYARNARGGTTMLRIAAWHDHMRAEFAAAADHLWEPAPRSRPFPPEGWTAPGGPHVHK